MRGKRGVDERSAERVWDALTNTFRAFQSRALRSTRARRHGSARRGAARHGAGYGAGPFAPMLYPSVKLRRNVRPFSLAENRAGSSGPERSRGQASSRSVVRTSLRRRLT